MANKKNLWKINYVEPTSYNNPYGIWEVTTEGDCEGRTVTRLGIYTGHIRDIAFYLVEHCYYSLHFTKLNIPEISTEDSLVSSRDYVDVSFGWGFPDNLEENSDIAKHCDRYYNNPTTENNIEYEVEASNYYKSVRFIRNGLSPEAKLRIQALQKLTDEEKKALGLLPEYYESKSQIPYDK